jgi:hypothetical protein
MKVLAPIGLLLLAQALPLAAAERHACDVRVDVTDTDPKGTNIRAAPGGAVLKVLKQPATDGIWIEVHITGQEGDWFEIDQALLIDGGADPSLFKGKGYLHKSVLGVSGMQNGAVIYSDHDVGSAPIDPHADGDQAVDLLGCWGEFLNVHVKKGTGWTKEPCTNMVTTCV